MKKTLYILLLLLVLTSCDAAESDQNTTYIYPPWRHTWGVRRATPFKLRMFVGNKTHFNNPQGLACVRLISWEDTTTASDDDEVTVYGVNSGDNCIIYNKSMYALGIYGLENDHEKLNRPWGIAADARGNVYVADRGEARIVRLFNPGSELRFTGVIGRENVLIPVVDPRGVALDAAGNLYVTDAAMGDVVVFDSAGVEVNRWEGLIQPDGVAVVGPDEEWLFNRRDAFAVVCDSMRKRIVKFSLSGERLASVQAGLTLPASWEFGYVVIDYHSQILVTDAANGCLRKFDSDLNLITSFGESGKGDYQFDQPRGIALYRRLGQLFVAEREGAQYLWVATSVSDFRASVRVDSVWKDLDVDFRMTEPALAEIDVYDQFHRYITRIAQGRRFRTGANHLSWSMIVPEREAYENRPTMLPPKISRGQPLPPGTYILEGKFRAVYCSTRYFAREARTEFKVK